MSSLLKYIAPIVLSFLALLGIFKFSGDVATVAFASWANYTQPYKPNLPPVELLDEVHH